jgi:hypothetical protein
VSSWGTRVVIREYGEVEVSHEVDDGTEAMHHCEAELGELDPEWFKFLDFWVLLRRSPARSCPQGL